MDKSYKEPQKNTTVGLRQSNIELLRILAIIGVIILHYNHRDGGGGFNYVVQGSANELMLRFLESLFICAVDVFILISGYFMCTTNKRNIIKPLQLILQMTIFSTGIYLFKVIFGFRDFALKSLMGALVPANYFVILYVVLYFISPYINLAMEKLSEHKKRQAVIIMAVLFSIYPSLVDIFTAASGREWMGLSTIGAWGSQWGYTIVNFTLLYIIGAYIRTAEPSKKRYKTQSLLLILCILTIVLTAWSLLDEDTAWEYCSPFVIIEAVVIFLLFSRLRMGTNKVINEFAKGAFSVYLLHPIFLPYVGAEKFVQGGILRLGGVIFLTAMGLYIICWAVYEIYNKVTFPIFKKLEKVISITIDLDAPD